MVSGFLPPPDLTIIEVCVGPCEHGSGSSAMRSVITLKKKMHTHTRVTTRIRDAIKYRTESTKMDALPLKNLRRLTLI